MNVILDIDGTIIENNVPINNSIEFLKRLQKNSIEFLLATNSIRSHKKQVERLGDLGFEISLSSFFTPIDSINVYLKLNRITRAFIIGSPLEIDQIACVYTDSDPEIIILLDFEKADISHKIIQKIVNLTVNGIPIVTASSSTFYTSRGRKVIDTGAYVKLIESITKTEIPTLGKPSLSYFANALECFSYSGETWIFGDDITTDILGGREAGLKTALMRSGKYRKGDEEKIQPHMIIDDLSEFFMNLHSLK